MTTGLIAHGDRHARHRDFLYLWGAGGFSTMADRVGREILPLAAILLLGAGPGEIGLLAACRMAPGMMAMAMGGLVDRVSRRRIMMGADCVRLMIMATIPVSLWFDALTIGQFYGVALMTGVAATAFDLADHAFLPDVVDPASLDAANGKLALTDGLAEGVAPALAGVILQYLTAATGFMLITVAYGMSVLCLHRITRRPESVMAKESLKPGDWYRGIGIGMRAVWSHPTLRTLLLLNLATIGLGSFFAAIYSLYALKILGITPAMLGMIIAMGGIGGIIGAIAAPRAARWLGQGRSVVAGLLLAGLANLAIPVAPTQSIGAVACLVFAQIVGDSFMVMSEINGISLRQTRIAPDLLGRTAAVFNAGQGLMGMAGALTGGVMGELIGVRATGAVAVIGMIGVALLALRSALWSQNRSNEEC